MAQQGDNGSDEDLYFSDGEELYLSTTSHIKWLKLKSDSSSFN